MRVTLSHFHPSLKYAGEVRRLTVEWTFKGLHWVIITVLKCFVVHAQGVKCYKTFLYVANAKDTYATVCLLVKTLQPSLVFDITEWNALRCNTKRPLNLSVKY